MIPQPVLDQIQDRCDIVELVQQYLPLRRAGRSFKSCCPFHTEKTPSFWVTPDKQIFHCFGCGAGGNVFTFLMKIEKLDFREAVRRLADRAGVVIPEDEQYRKTRDEHAPLYEANRLAAEFFIRFLRESHADSPARRYIARRGLSERARTDFKVGYSPNEWDRLIRHFSGKFTPELLERAGLALKKQGGGWYDRFRGRLMFPITDAKGRVVGFGGRVLDDSTPKYINSPETAVYQKGRTLYGLYEALDGIRENDRIIIVEGYTDVTACFEAGCAYAVSSSGTALTTDQIRLLKRYTRRVTVLFDADQAGRMATLRGLDLLVEEGCDVDVAAMPQGHDPDSYVKDFGAEKFRAQVIGAARPLFEYKYGLLARQYDASKVGGKAQIAGEMLGTICRIPNEVLKAGWVRELSGRLHIPEDALLAEMRKAASSLRGPVREAAAGAPRQEPAAPLAVPPGEKLILGLAVNFEDLWQKARDNLKAEDFMHPDSRLIAGMVLGAEQWSRIRPSRILNYLENNERASAMIRQAVQEAESIGEERRQQAYDDCLRRLDQLRQRRLQDVLLEKITACERMNDQENLGKFLKEFAQVRKKGKSTDG